MAVPPTIAVLPPLGCVLSLPHPVLWGRRLPPNSPHGKKSISLLAYSPEVVYALLFLYSDLYLGHRSLPHPVDLLLTCKETTGQPRSTVLPPRY